MSKCGNNPNSNTKYWIIIIVLLVLLVGVGGYLIWGQDSDGANAQGKAGKVDAAATDWDDGLNKPSEIEGRILVPGYSGAKLQAGSDTLALRIGNPAENTCYLQATLMLEDGTVLYESGLIEPGKGFDEIKLTQTLEAGTYNAYVHYQGYSLDDEKQALNSCDSAFTLTVTE